MGEDACRERLAKAYRLLPQGGREMLTREINRLRLSRQLVSSEAEQGSKIGAGQFLKR